MIAELCHVPQNQPLPFVHAPVADQPVLVPRGPLLHQAEDPLLREGAVPDLQLVQLPPEGVPLRAPDRQEAVVVKPLALDESAAARDAVDVHLQGGPVEGPGHVMPPPPEDYLPCGKVVVVLANAKSDDTVAVDVEVPSPVDPLMAHDPAVGLVLVHIHPTADSDFRVRETLKIPDKGVVIDAVELQSRRSLARCEDLGFGSLHIPDAA
mmetsp:Transcript_21618/g.51632  ORF Transcript_21618/g.51632 Transcript_21618/m.51632 type:complete len:209 (-) Transcript_21618:29-655(-)